MCGFIGSWEYMTLRTADGGGADVVLADPGTLDLFMGVYHGLLVGQTEGPTEHTASGPAIGWREPSGAWVVVYIQTEPGSGPRLGNTTGRCNRPAAPTPASCRPPATRTGPLA